jgi:hypothetical protein
MNVLFDQGVPVPLRPFLTNHKVATAYELGWDKLQNGELLRAADKPVTRSWSRRIRT